jgi:hypothetical protein
VLLNTGEGSSQRGARRTNHYAIALGSARESLLALAAEAWGHIGPVPQDVIDNFDQVIGTLNGRGWTFDVLGRWTVGDDDHSA